jgi:aspartate kinase
MIVMKFGGTSVRDADAMDRAARIVASRAKRAPVVVVSAMSGVTSSLLEAARLAQGGSADGARTIVEDIRRMHLELLGDLAPEADALGEAVDAAVGDPSPEATDRIAAFGEILSSRIFAARLSERIPTIHMDTRELIVTDDRFTRANPLEAPTRVRTREKLAARVRPGSAIVVGGYMACTEDGRTTTLGRGGSDYTATLIGAALDAEEIEIWTDVDGMMTADPRVIGEAWTIRHISFAEASELAYFGAKVLHPATLLPAVRTGIPVRILNSMRPERSGTVITAEAPVGRTPIKAFACKRGITGITITSSRMLMAWGFLSALFEVFERHRTSVDVVTTSEVSVSLTTDDDSALREIVSDLERFGTVGVERDLALVSMVGARLKDRPGIASHAFGCLEDINIRMISQGASNINLSFVVRGPDADAVMRRLHDRFFKEPEPEIFERVG